MKYVFILLVSLSILNVSASDEAAGLRGIWVGNREACLRDLQELIDVVPDSWTSLEFYNTLLAASGSCSRPRMLDRYAAQMASYDARCSAGIPKLYELLYVDARANDFTYRLLIKPTGDTNYPGNIDFKCSNCDFTTTDPHHPISDLDSAGIRSAMEKHYLDRHSLEGWVDVGGDDLPVVSHK